LEETLQQGAFTYSTAHLKIQYSASVQCNWAYSTLAGPNFMLYCKPKQVLRVLWSRSEINTIL